MPTDHHYWQTIINEVSDSLTFDKNLCEMGIRVGVSERKRDSD